MQVGHIFQILPLGSSLRATRPSVGSSLSSSQLTSFSGTLHDLRGGRADLTDGEAARVALHGSAPAPYTYMKNTLEWVKFPYFIYIEEAVVPPVVITCLPDYISDLTEMQTLISKVTAASSLRARLPPAEARLHVACVKYCFMRRALSKCVFINLAETGDIQKEWLQIF